MPPRHRLNLQRICAHILCGRDQNATFCILLLNTFLMTLLCLSNFDPLQHFSLGFATSTFVYNLTTFLIYYFYLNHPLPTVNPTTADHSQTTSSPVAQAQPQLSPTPSSRPPPLMETTPSLSNYSEESEISPTFPRRSSRLQFTSLNNCNYDYTESPAFSYIDDEIYFSPKSSALGTPLFKSKFRDAGLKPLSLPTSPTNSEFSAENSRSIHSPEITPPYTKDNLLFFRFPQSLHIITILIILTAIPTTQAVQTRSQSSTADMTASISETYKSLFSPDENALILHLPYRNSRTKPTCPQSVDPTELFKTVQSAKLFGTTSKKILKTSLSKPFYNYDETVYGLIPLANTTQAGLAGSTALCRTQQGEPLEPRSTGQLKSFASNFPLTTTDYIPYIPINTITMEIFTPSGSALRDISGIVASSIILLIQRPNENEAAKFTPTAILEDTKPYSLICEQQKYSTYTEKIEDSFHEISGLIQSNNKIITDVIKAYSALIKKASGDKSLAPPPPQRLATPSCRPSIIRVANQQAFSGNKLIYMDVLNSANILQSVKHDSLLVKQLLDVLEEILNSISPEPEYNKDNTTNIYQNVDSLQEILHNMDKWEKTLISIVFYSATSAVVTLLVLIVYAKTRLHIVSRRYTVISLGNVKLATTQV